MTEIIFIWYETGLFNLVPSANMEEVGFMTHTASTHKGAIKTWWDFNVDVYMFGH